MTKDTGGSAFPIVEQRNSIGDITAYFAKAKPSQDHLGATYIKFPGNRKLGIHYALNGHLYSVQTNKLSRSIFSIVKVKRAKC